MSRASMMILSLLVVHILLGVLCLVVARGEKRPLALRLWGAGLLAYAAGLLTTLLTLLPPDVAKVAGNSIIALSAILTAAGLLEHSDTRLNRNWVAIAYGLTVLVLIANHLRPVYSVAVDVIAPSPIANVLFVIAAVALLRTPSPDAKTAARFLAGILVFCVMLWTVRLGLIWLALGGTNNRDRADLTISLFAIGQILIAVAATLGLFWVEVRKMEAALQRLASLDALTGLPNRRASLLRFQDEAARGIRHQRPFSIIVFDVDNFKKLNDTYGHAFGDEVLRSIARGLDAAKREVDIVGRLGGEEFIVVLSEESASGALIAANRLRSRIEPIATLGGNEKVTVTLSGGVASAPVDGSTWEELFAVADARLYEAKRAGRDRVVADGYPQTPESALARRSVPAPA